MEARAKRITKRVLKIGFFTLAGLILLLFFIPILLPNEVSQKIKAVANNALTGEVNFSKARLSFFNHFPSLTLSLYDFTLKGSAPYKKDTLLAADELAWGIDIPSLFSSKVRINRFFITKPKIKILVNEKGEANYNVYKTDSSSNSNKNDSSTASLKIQKIVITNADLIYDDKSIPLEIHARNMDYSGSGDLSKAIFDLQSRLYSPSFDFTYDNVPYIMSKEIKADLVTKINTNSLALQFEKDNMRIHDLPVQFNGWFAFLAKGYDMSFDVHTRQANLKELLSVLPPEYDKWVANVQAKGAIEMHVSLAGKYISSQNTMPNLGFDFKVKDGYLLYAKATNPIEDLQLELHSTLNNLAPDSLDVKLDSLRFRLQKNFFDSKMRIKGMTQPYVEGNVKSQLDLEELDRTLGLSSFDLKGQYNLELQAKGKYSTGQDPKKIRKSIITTSIPNYELKSSLKNGYFKMGSLPESINDISFDLNSSCTDNQVNHVRFSLENLNAKALGNFMKGYCRYDGSKEVPIDAHVETKMRLEDLKKFYPVDSLLINGLLAINIDTKGKYDPEKKQFPVTEANIDVTNGSVQTKYYPHPIQDVQVKAKASDKDGTLADLDVIIDAFKFQFEGQPFVITADLRNFENLHYAVMSKGSIDVGKVYKVFARDQYDVKGFIETNFSLNGTQEDATKGRYSRLQNTGSMRVRDVVVRADYFPLPFYVDEGVFRFSQDKVWFEKFIARYGKSHLRVDGALTNIINYALQPNEPLEGSFQLASKHLYADEFAAFAGNFPEDARTEDSTAQEDGVVMVPSNLRLTFDANIDTAEFQGLQIDHFKGEVIIDSSKIKMKQTGFSMIDASVIMDASYSHISPTSAQFDFHIKADSFDVNKAYKEVKLFRELAPSAKSVYGVIGLDYSLAGKLDANMYPILPSLSGGGVLSVSKVKLKGFKLMNAVSKSTNKEEMTDPDLSKINIKSTIANNILTIEKTKMRIAGFRPRFEGQCTLDGKLNLKGRIGLPPFGIFGIPFTVKGTQDNPIVKLKKDKDGKPLEVKDEKESEEEVQQ
jgi:AsmA protein